MQSTVHTLDELYRYVSDFLSTLEKKKHATIIALSGDLGVGKTAFVKAAGTYFNVSETITSPTFVIQKEYLIPHHQVFTHMIHIDAYRLASSDELEYLQWATCIQNPETIIFIEWPEQVLGIAMPEAYRIHIDIDTQEPTHRIIGVSRENTHT